MQDQPDAKELLRAVRSFIERELIPTISDPRLRFRSLVAVNVLAIVGRELGEGTAPLRIEWERLAILLNRPGDKMPESDDALREAVLALNRELAARIRSGELDEDPLYSAALQHAEAMVIEKLRVANPRYLERVSN